MSEIHYNVVLTGHPVDSLKSAIHMGDFVPQMQVGVLVPQK